MLDGVELDPCLTKLSQIDKNVEFRWTTWDQSSWVKSNWTQIVPNQVGFTTNQVELDLHWIESS